MHSRWTNHADARTLADTTIYDNIHTTNLTKQKAFEMIDQASEAGGQFFLMVAPGESLIDVKHAVLLL